MGLLQEGSSPPMARRLFRRGRGGGHKRRVPVAVHHGGRERSRVLAIDNIQGDGLLMARRLESTETGLAGVDSGASSHGSGRSGRRSKGLVKLARNRVFGGPCLDRK